jgi:hypothetical protein
MVSSLSMTESGWETGKVWPINADGTPGPRLYEADYKLIRDTMFARFGLDLPWREVQ